MDQKNTRFPEPKEVVGSKDLRESFKDTDRIRGSFFINGVEMHQFEANSPSSVVSQINAKSGQHFVTAEIDDGGHLVLIDKSGHDILIRPGAAYVDAPPASTGDAAKDVLAHLKSAAKADQKDGDHGNNILEMLGLDANDETTEATAQLAGERPGFETGLSADQRRDRWRRETGQMPPQIGQAGPYPETGQARPQDATQIPSNPTPGNTGSQGKLDDGRMRTGTGGGAGETSGAAARQSANQRGINTPA